MMQQRAVQVAPATQMVQPLPTLNAAHPVKDAQNIKKENADDKFYFYLNEKKITLDSVDPTMTLNDFIRGQRMYSIWR